MAMISLRRFSLSLPLKVLLLACVILVLAFFGFRTYPFYFGVRGIKPGITREQLLTYSWAGCICPLLEYELCLTRVGPVESYLPGKCVKPTCKLFMMSGRPPGEITPATFDYYSSKVFGFPLLESLGLGCIYALEVEFENDTGESSDIVRRITRVYRGHHCYSFRFVSCPL